MGAGRGAGRGSLETLKRCGRTLFFLVSMVGSLFVSSGPLLVSILDVFVVLSAFTCCRSCFSFRADWATYSFRSSLVDIPLLSVGRSLAALFAYAVCGIPSLCHGPYLLTTVASGMGTTVFLSVKASMFDNYDLATGSPLPAGGRRHKMGLPLLLVSSAIFALIHIFVAYKARCQARRKFSFDRSDMDALASKILYQRLSRISSAKSLRKNDLESNMISKPQQDDGKDLPAHLLADYDSLFLDLKELLVHYKSAEGNVYNQVPLRNTYERHELIPQYTRSLSHGNFSTAWNPLVRSPTLQKSYSVHTPLLSD